MTPNLMDSDLKLNQHDHILFQRGFKFHSKYIGTMDVPRPVSRLEIVSAMRRIRFDFKARSVKKKDVLIEVGLDGVGVSLHEKVKLLKHQGYNENYVPLFKNPIHRIFYVSHDSKDVKIFSYIAKEDDSNVFKCSVFKALKKKDAGEIVKTIGQAFEVSHLVHQTKKQEQQQKQQQQKQQLKKLQNEIKSDNEEDIQKDAQTDIYTDIDACSLLSFPPSTDAQAKNYSESEEEKAKGNGTDTSNQHIQTLQQKVKLKGQENVLLRSQNKLLQKQLQVEIQARKQAEVLTERLLSQNKDLFSQIDMLLKKLSLLGDKNLNKTAIDNLERSSKTRTLDLSLLSSSASEHPKETKNSPDSGLNEMDDQVTEEDKKKHQNSNEDLKNNGIDDLKNMTGTIGGVENAAIESTPVRNKPNGTMLPNGCGNLHNNKDAVIDHKNETNDIKLKQKNSSQKNLSMSTSLYNKLNTKLLQSILRSSKNLTPKKPDKTDKSLKGDKSRPVSSVSERFENGVMTSKWGKKIDKMINIRKSMGDSTTELELSFED